MPTIENITENNRLIAEFMGYEGQHEEWCGNNVLDENGLGFEEMRPYNPHTNWSDLMPAVEKIKKDPKSKILLEMGSLKDSIVPYLNAIRPLNKALLDLDMQFIYTSVLHFINWYNQNKNTHE